ncbi:major facilitator superfamily domain-containing protein [Aspergillus alliaceus]|uniref:Major facilitator superfamily domain-containing protein n=1 Tax=Petromyces alliaceus TaxID=209559 RepID=A0A5N7C5A2_PETAA|nr:major facilitator superfamily domain-containing protein [Aspergillus alliaceus]
MFTLSDSQRFSLTILALSLTSLTASLSVTSLSNALPVITNELKGTDIEAFWAGTAYVLCSAVFQPPFAIFSHIFGRKPLFVIAFLFFLSGSAIATAAKNFRILLAARAIQGTGGGGLITLSEILTADLTPLRERGKWIGLLSMMWAVGSVAGPIVGGALAHERIWRWLFALNLPLASASLAVICVSVKPRIQHSDFRQALSRVDWPGFGIFIPSMTSFLIPVTWGGETFPWYNWHTLVLLSLGVFGLSLFTVYETWIAHEPFLLRSIFHEWNTKVIYSQTFFHGLLVWSLLYYLPLYYQGVKGFSPLVSGIAVLPETCTISAAAGVVGLLITTTGRYRWALWTGWLVTTTGLGLLYLLDFDCPTYRWVIINLTVGLGMGSLFTSTNLAIQANIPINDLSFALGFFAFFRTLGQSVGIAVGGTVFHNMFERNLPADSSILALTQGHGIDAAPLIEVLNGIPDQDPRKHKIIHAYVEALRILWLVLCGCSALGLLASFFTKAYSLGPGHNRGHRTEADDYEDPETANVTLETRKGNQNT